MEEWRNVDGWPYEVSNKGRVRSDFTMRPLVGGVDKDGYRKLVVCSGDGRRGYKRVSTLVCEAFHGPRPSGLVVRHLDGDNTNDDAENLAWSTQKENLADRKAHGTLLQGERHPLATITADTALAIFAATGKQADIASRFGVKKTIVSSIKTGRTWSGVTGHRHPDRP